MKVVFPPFPNSSIDPFLITSPETNFYNCIAWAYGDDTKWFWPEGYHWPDDIKREVTLDCFILLFEKIGYSVCPDESFEVGFDKVAIYANSNGVPTHAARQLPNGLWTSKLGPSFDVTHSIFAMDGGFYGSVAVYMKRPK